MLASITMRGDSRDGWRMHFLDVRMMNPNASSYRHLVHPPATDMLRRKKIESMANGLVESSMLHSHHLCLQQLEVQGN